MYKTKYLFKSQILQDLQGEDYDTMSWNQQRRKDSEQNK